MDYEDKIKEFNFAMERKLVQNDDKGGWEGCTFEYLLRRAREELDELDEAIKADRPLFAVVDEAADVANFAMMIADNYKQYKLKKMMEKMSDD